MQVRFATGADAHVDLIYGEFEHSSGHAPFSLWLMPLGCCLSKEQAPKNCPPYDHQPPRKDWQLLCGTWQLIRGNLSGTFGT